MRKALIAIASSAVLVGCGPRIQALKGDAISVVQADLKRQIGVYARAAARGPFWMEGRQFRFIDRNSSEFWCGRGDIDYVISSVDVELTTTRDTTVGGSIGFTVPVQIITLEAKAGVSKNVQDVEVMKYHLWPVQETVDQLVEFYGHPTIDEIDSAPIASALLTLRNQQVYAAMKRNPSVEAHTPTASGAPTGPQPCFKNYDPIKTTAGERHTFSIGITTTYGANGELKVGLGPVGIGPSGETKSITGQTLLVNFEQRNLEAIKLLSEARQRGAAVVGRGPGRREGQLSAEDLAKMGVLSGKLDLDRRTFNELMGTMEPRLTPPQK